MAFNENTRVKIPAILHLSRLGFKYLSLAEAVIDPSTNIFTDIFSDSIRRINQDHNRSEPLDIKRILEDISLTLENEDLGKAFYEMLTAQSGLKLIDFENFANNSFHVVTELTYKNGDDEFRPDITVLINGMPLIFIEVKKPNNHEGILAERERINQRFQNKKLRKFINISQILVFSNNMEYDSESIVPIQGAFYATTSYQRADFNCFREEENFNLSNILSPEDEQVENFVLQDNNLSTIKHSPEFITNKLPNTPTNRILTSLFNRDRLGMLLKYSIVYVKGSGAIEKHIMRYPQFFATKAIERKLESGIKKGIIWHTQGSGKTALAFYNVHYLTDYYERKKIVPKFYFIVDRLDLMIQAQREFSSRGLVVHTVISKEELLNDFRLNQAIHNSDGQREITVVNIQKFKEDDEILRTIEYDLRTQRIYFLDEVHRSYDIKGSFLANLISSDRNAVHIGLTGTPLIGVKHSRDIFGDYIHKYYYNASIADGYTLRLIREGIETQYKIQLEKVLKEIEILKSGIERREIFAHERFAEPMLEYIVQDFLKSRIAFGDHSIGGMVVCDSSAQARMLYQKFICKYNTEQGTVEPNQPIRVADAPEEYNRYRDKHGHIVASLILHDVGSTFDRKQEIEDFKEGKIDLLFVYNMLLTGFDARRLKKLYIARLVRDHNLLQTLTRVNRPYKDFRYGFVVDFADIRKEFDATNKAYFEELQLELGDEVANYSNLFKTKEEIEHGIALIKDKLFRFDLNNAEIFSQQITQITNREEVLEIKKALEDAKNLYNLIRMMGHHDLLNKVDFRKLNDLFNETARHLDLLNLKESIENNIDSTNLLNVALENVLFKFRKISEEELVIADQLRDILHRTHEALGSNFDPKDHEFISLYDELKRLFQKKNLSEITQDEMKKNIGSLERIYEKVNNLNRNNNQIKAKYTNDPKFARVHKRILEKGTVTKRESQLHETLMIIKEQADQKVLNNTQMLDNEGYFSGLMSQLVVNTFEEKGFELDAETARFINSCVVKEYINEYEGNSDGSTRIHSQN